MKKRASAPKSAKRRLVSYEEAQEANGQHKKPCGDCPFARASLNGWLGSATIEEWVRAAHSENRLDCHTLLGAQCAGGAIYRANVAKKPRDPDILILERDHELVFATPTEFMEHHKKAPVKG